AKSQFSLPRRRRFPTSNGEQPALDPAGVVSAASATAAGSFSFGQIDGTLAAGLRWDQDYGSKDLAGTSNIFSQLSEDVITKDANN
ncbi:Os01g0362800, partial [Oryza sativa Japonica Group]